MASSVRQGHETGVDGTVLFHAILGIYVPWKRYTKPMRIDNRDIHPFISPLRNFCRAYTIRYDTIRYATLKRGIVHVGRVCCTTVIRPSAHWIADDGYQEGQDGCFFKGTSRNQKLITRLTLSSLYHPTNNSLLFINLIIFIHLWYG